MRVRRKALLALPAAVGIAFAIAGAQASAAPPVSGYGWQQPGCAPVTVPCAQPPVSVPIATAGIVSPAAGSDYSWAQPGTALVETPSAQPRVIIPAS